ncbi:MAG: metH2, partial [Oscillospiraceae bacterium]|nr:metH2 [Oscillospiraceae bacterium]
MRIRQMLKSGFIILDGAMGTMLQKKGLKLGERPEILSIIQSDIIEEIHREYIKSGADIVYTNTFGANAHKLEGTGYTVEQIIEASVGCAKRACKGTNSKVALDIGPLGELLEPAGSLSFEEAYELFRQQMVQGEKSGADCIVIETMTDLYEVKAAVLAAKEHTALPVFVTMTFEQNHRTFTGCSVASMALTLEGLGVDAMGINCSLGPEEIFPIAKELATWTSLPVIVKANAGLPNLNSNEYDISAESFAGTMSKYADEGITIMGGCCGTTPEYIKEIKKVLSQKQPVKCDFKRVSAVCSPTKAVVIDGVRIIGERINPTGKKLFKQALINNDIDYILSQGVSQVEAGAHILDVNVGLPEIDEVSMMIKVVKQLQSVIDVPLQIDSSDPKAVEAALRVYNGKAIVNSVNGEEKVLDTLLPIVKKYGAAIVGLTLDQNGIPNEAETRFQIAKKILDKAVYYGIPKEDVYIDCLTLTASVQQKEVVETLKAVKMVTEQLGLKTVLGVSNISFGLPNRELINHSFLLLAMSHGLTLPIINPNISQMVDAVYAYNVLYNKDENATDYILKYNTVKTEPKSPAQQGVQTTVDINHAISKGLREEAKQITNQLLLTTNEMEIVNTLLIPALDVVGTRFEKGEIFLPQLLQSAQAAQSAFEEIKAFIASKGRTSISKGKIVLATVKGDIHDIGKNIVKVILENYGYQIIDLGRDV